MILRNRVFFPLQHHLKNVKYTKTSKIKFLTKHWLFLAQNAPKNNLYFGIPSNVKAYYKRTDIA